VAFSAISPTELCDADEFALALVLIFFGGTLDAKIVISLRTWASTVGAERSLAFT